MICLFISDRTIGLPTMESENTGCEALRGWDVGKSVPCPIGRDLERGP